MELPILGIKSKSAGKPDNEIGPTARGSRLAGPAASPLRTARIATAFICLLLLKTSAVLGQDDPDAYCTGDPCQISADIEVEDGSDVDFGDRVVVLTGVLSIRDGDMTIRAGELRITGQGQLNASRGDGGGSFEVLTTGDILIDGQHDGGAIRLAGGDGGFLTMDSSAGTISGAGEINVNGTDVIGDGGCIDLSAGGDINLTGPIEGLSGLQAAAAELDAVADGDVILSGDVDLTGGEDGGGSIFIDASGSVVLGSMTLDGRGELGDAGDLDVSAEGSMELNGTIRARGSNGSVEFCGDGGDGLFDAGEDLIIAAQFDFDARRGDCLAGSLDFRGNTVSIEGPISIRGEGVNGSAGELDVTASERISCTADVDGRGSDDGGVVMIMLNAPMPSMDETAIDCQMDLTGPRAVFDLVANTNVTVSGSILAGTSQVAAGSAGVTGPIQAGGMISIEGCTVDIARNATLISEGPGSTNRITAREDTVVLGDLTADESNEFRFRPGYAPFIGGLVMPQASLSPDGSLQSCGFPTQTPTITPTATQTPTPTPTPLPCVGDCNHDGFVSVDELVLGLDIGLGIENVSACPQADANEDGSVDVSEAVTAVGNSINGCSGSQ